MAESFNFGANVKPKFAKPKASGTGKRRRKASPSSRKHWRSAKAAGVFGS